MKYYTENELQNFRFEGAYIAETCAVNGIFEMILDNVTILPQNSCNRDIREMRANELKLKIREPEITAFVEEGYKVYDADRNPKENKEEYTKYTYELDENEKPTGIIAKTTSTGTVIDINGNAYDETKTDTRTIGITIE